MKLPETGGVRRSGIGDDVSTRYLDGSPEERYETTALEVFFGQGDGTFEHAPDLIDGTIRTRQPIVVAADFNSDEQADLAVFDAGVYVGGEGVGYGNPPQLWLSDNDGVPWSLSVSDRAADPAFNDGHTAVQALNYFDVNNDGFEDLLLMHERDGPPEVLLFTGRYIQVDPRATNYSTER